MANFCTNCGAKLAEGEQHVCPNAPAAASNASAGGSFDFGAIVKEFTDDVAGWFKGEKQKVGIVTSSVFTVASYLLNSLFFVFVFVALSNMINKGLAGWYKVSLPSGVSFWWGLLILLIAYAFTFVLDVYKYVLAKEKIDFVASFSRAATTSALCSVALFVGGLLGMLVWWFAVPFVLIAVVLRVRDYASMTTSIVTVKNDILNKFLVSAILAVIVAVGLWVTGLCMKGYLESGLEGASSILGMLM